MHYLSNVEESYFLAFTLFKSLSVGHVTDVFSMDDFLRYCERPELNGKR